MVQSMFDSFLRTECIHPFQSTFGGPKDKGYRNSIANGLPTAGKRQRVGIILY